MTTTSRTLVDSPRRHRDAGTSWIWALTLAAVLIGATVLLLAIGEEPYHIDELRQVRAYEGPVGWIITKSFQQTQPPLDSLLNAAAQRVIGVGDWQQRALSVFFGIGSLLLFGWLLIRARLGFGAPVAVLLLALSPLLVSVTAYARPYALPLFLLLVFVLSSDLWLRNDTRWAIPAIYASALVLPLSRTVEPPIALAAVIVVLLIWRYAVPERPERTIWVPVSAAALGLVFVAAPVALRMRQEVTGFTESSLVPSMDQLRRLATDLIPALGDAFPWWPLVLVVVVLAFVHPTSRGLISEAWWFWVLALVAVGFAVVFFARVPISQPYYTRYTFSWWPPFAFIGGAITTAILSTQTRRALTIAGTAAAALALVAAGMVLTLRTDLTTTSNADWKAAGEAISSYTSSDTTVFFDHTRSFGSYRTAFAGRIRYVDRERLIPLTQDVVSRPDLAGEDGPVAIMVLGNPPHVPGWDRIEVDAFWLYIPKVPTYGRASSIDALLLFADALGPDNGTAMVLGAASLAADLGDVERACRIIEDHLTEVDDGLSSRIEDFMQRVSSTAPWFEKCGTF